MNHASQQSHRNPPAQSLNRRMFGAFSLVMLVATGAIAIVVNSAIGDIALSERGKLQQVNARAFDQLLVTGLANEMGNFKVRAETVDELALAEQLPALQKTLDRVQNAIRPYSHGHRDAWHRWPGGLPNNPQERRPKPPHTDHSAHWLCFSQRHRQSAGRRDGRPSRQTDSFSSSE